MSGVVWPSFSPNAASTQLVFTGPNCQTPFSVGGLFGTGVHAGTSLFGGTFSTGAGAPMEHTRVPALIGVRRLVFIFP
jgi:hypothetical protein